MFLFNEGKRTFEVSKNDKPSIGLQPDMLKA